MRLPLLLALLATASVPALAQTAPTPTSSATSALPDFDTQKKVLSAPRIDTVDELRDQGRNLLGQTVELRGVVKAIFGGGTGLSFLLELPDGQSQTVNATSSFKNAPGIQTGSWVRVLSRVQAKVGDNAVLQLVNVTTKGDSKLFAGAGDDTSAALRLPQNVPGAPPPADVVIGIGSSTTTNDGVIIGPEVELPPAPPAYSPAPVTIKPPVQRSAPRPPAAAAAKRNIFFGFDDSSRAAFKSLAMRTNPRLSEESADDIAFSLLEAAQAQNLDPRFLAAIVQVESEFNPYAVSGAGAMGLGQLMPFNLRSLGVADAWSPRQNLHGAAKLLRQNLNVYANDRNGTMLAVAAYHAGVGAVNRAGRAIPKATTQKYVWKVYYAYRALAPELFH